MPERTLNNAGPAYEKMVQERDISEWPTSTIEFHSSYCELKLAQTETGAFVSQLLRDRLKLYNAELLIRKLSQ